MPHKRPASMAICGRSCSNSDESITLYSVKLYAVGPGAISPNPSDWSERGGFALVVAETPEQALEVADDLEGLPVVEVDTSKPAMLSHRPFTGSW
jgi:hypothetical protein